MTPSFQLVGIDHEPFESLFLLSDEALKEHHAERRIAAESPGYPCRVSLEDAKVGEELLLLPYLHQPAASPYRASGPIFVRRAAKQRRLEVGEVSSYVTGRLMSVRAYDKAHMIVAASVCEGMLVAKRLESYFGNDQVDYIHLHNAERGCFSCQVIRA
ncbi:hypothetical protein HDE76_002564 [Rhodanobacter sp. ANJX3]|uniref:DUF1203 domain-containing protein n=1 Tax=unclassified Rhodanobacter TaxID=2621553 RepID=UPI0015CE7991|nr:MULTISPECIES: DUF1203 domain-containing protein [unclassified Rhodanobacter]MBB5359335.1 hypothetical protein [Rhodanobacter sp. ANJX3]NYE29913.1 hypothetical protein [Rhodanobacter sp. K2T2]